MNKWMCLLVCLFARVAAESSVPQHFSENRDPPAVDKIYIQPSDIAVEKDQIKVYTGGEWYSIPALFADEDGIYFDAASRRYRTRWICKVCTYNNPGDLEFCYQCHVPRPVD